MNIKTAVLAIILATGFPVAAQAQHKNSYESLQVSCQPSAECNNFEVNYQQDEVAQFPRRTRMRRTRSSLDNKYYAGGNLGVFFPFNDNETSDADADVGFGLGGLFGYRFTENISGELEVSDYFGGSNVDDLGYNLLGITANGVYRYYFNPENSKSLYAFGGVGVGVGISNATGDVADSLDAQGVDTSDTGFLLQGKAGVGYPVADQIDIFGQARFTNLFISGDEDVDNSGDDSNGLSVDVGATYNF